MSQGKHITKSLLISSNCGMGWYVDISIFEGGGAEILDSSLAATHCEEDDEEGIHEIEVLERLILAHAEAGVDVETVAYAAGIDTALEALANAS
jgi:hypothetical protein